MPIRGRLAGLIAKALIGVVLVACFTLPASPASAMQIFVRTLVGSQTVIDCEPSDTILNAKQKYFVKTGTPPDQMKFYFQGHVLEDGRLLSEFSIEANSVITMVRRLLRQVSTPTPVISGELRVGGTLSADAGTWDDGVALTYEWQRTDTGAVVGTDSTYVISADDIGHTLGVFVTGSLATYEPATMPSASTGMVRGGALTGIPTPLISGLVNEGVSLTVDPGTWPVGTVLTYQWRSDGQAVTGATASTLTLNATLVGHRISVVVSGEKVGYDVSNAASQETSAVVGYIPLRPIPRISSDSVTPRVGSLVQVFTGSWTPGTRLSFVWFRDGREIIGATQSSLIVTREDLGHTLRVTVHGQAAGYVSVARVSNSLTFFSPVLPLTSNDFFIRGNSIQPGAVDVVLKHPRPEIQIIAATRLPGSRSIEVRYRVIGGFVASVHLIPSGFDSGN